MKCPRCGQPFHSGPDFTFCSSCGYSDMSVDESTRPLRRLDSIPWEDAGNFGIFKALYLTCKELLLSPDTFFSKLALSSQTKTAWLFALITGSLAGVIALIWEYFPIGQSFLYTWFPPELLAQSNTSGVYLLLTPLLVTLEVGILSLYFHFLFFIFRAKERALHKTFAILCYSQVSSLAVIIPLAGELIGGIWFIILCISGFHKVYSISRLRAFAIIFVPFIIMIITAAVFIAFMALFGIVFGDLLKEISGLYR
ncbi:MAG: hypothetical protein GF401_19960 [Chitinivibrionales bacterium]|nr:hypothetical protein [Chitinivibrionales bacterium]